MTALTGLDTMFTTTSAGSDDDTAGFTPMLVAGAAAAGFATGVATVVTGIAIGYVVGAAINEYSNRQPATESAR